MHRITNNGNYDITATDSRGIVWTVKPGKTAILSCRRIWHGDNPANYTVEPFEAKEAMGKLGQGAKK